MKRESHGNVTYTGNAQFRGYCVDLLEKISKMVGFNYTIKVVEDGFHGALVGKIKKLRKKMILSVRNV
jgi:hypothetical protein